MKNSALHKLATPVRKLADHLHEFFGAKWDKEHTHCVVGGIVCVLASGVAITAHAVIHSHFLIIPIDAASYGVHGIGLAPIAKAVGRKLNIDL